MRDDAKISRFLAPLSMRIRNMLARCVIKAINDDHKLQTATISILKNELKGNVEVFQLYGLDVNPPADTEAVVVCPNGDRSSAIVLAMGDRRFRITGKKSGEVAIYTDEGDYIHLKRNHNVEIKTLHLKTTAEDATFDLKNMTVNADNTAFNLKNMTVDAENATFTLNNMNISASDSVSIDTPLIDATGDINSAQNIKDNKGTMQQIRDLHNTHTHQDSMNGSTQPPSAPM